MADNMVLGLAKEAGVRIYVGRTTDIVVEARDRHKTVPTATVVMGKALTAAALMSGLLKVSQRTALKWQGTGPIVPVVVEADSSGAVRGYVGDPAVDLPLVEGQPDVVGAIGRAGLLMVAKDTLSGELAQDTVHLATSDIDGDLVFYLEESEQVPSLVKTVVALDEDGVPSMAGGILIQPLPPNDPAVIDAIRERLEELPPLVDLLAAERSPRDTLADLLEGVDGEFISQYPLRYRCNCSWERSRLLLAGLGRDEVEAILESDGRAEIECHYCHENYLFERDDLVTLLEEMPE